MKNDQNEKNSLFFEQNRYGSEKKPPLSEHLFEIDKSAVLGENFCPLLAPTIFR